MSDKRENIRINNNNSFFWMLILALGLFICHNTTNSPPDRNKIHVKTETLAEQSTAILLAGSQIQDYQETRVSDNNTIKLLSFARIQFLENKKTIQQISLLRIKREKAEWFPVTISRYHLFPTERDEIPLLS